MIDAVLARPGPSTIAYFFAGDQYVEYDWAAPVPREGHGDYARDGVHSIAEWGLPASFVGEGPGNAVEAALAGRHAFAAYGYLFRGGSYMRYRWLPPGPEPGESQSIALWNVPASLDRVDAAFNGALNRSRYAYFTRGSRYYRYAWDTGAVEANYPRQIGTLVGMPAGFAGGFDAACDGMGPYTDKAYFFKDDQYIRFQWVASGEPHVAGTPDPIQGHWLGLAELLATARAKTEALAWLASALPKLHGYADFLKTGVAAPEQALVEASLRAHFHINPASPVAARTASLNAILGMLDRVEATLRASATMFRFRTDTEAVADNGVVLDPSGHVVLDPSGKPIPHAAYTGPMPPSPATRINVTRNFLVRSVRNRVSSLLHEAVHVIDPVSDMDATPNPVHIPEWYVTAPEATKLGLTFVPDNAAFERRYDQMTTANALHNPAAYATLARHLHFRADNRELP
ncbi:hypothetical protein [Roseicella aquatilis]|uniref:Uncharacterized protein n=1 Tax=Roseicella aquatilis TaxID=2527868 RepID=A0A4R4D6A9_9PROT|nr:hypothetical protein [Roseicella aquatilis]TCZ53399.1 hypothetical protein EXY23_24710 [Roseicella aquatilis]